MDITDSELSSTPSKTPRTFTADEELDNYAPYLLMEDLLDKLKLINYDNDFMKNLKMRPINRQYFAVASNPGEQFFMFTTMTSWLIQKLGLPFTTPQEYDDPNSTIASIMDALRNLNIPVDFSPSKLKKGSGWHILQTLTHLVDRVIEKENILFQRPIPPKERDEVYEVVEDNVEVVLDRIEEEMAAEDSDMDEDNVLNVDDLNIPTSYFETSAPEEILESQTTFEDWNNELERVLPMLRVSIKTSNEDWRSHLESMKENQDNLNKEIGPVEQQLNKLVGEIDNVLEKATKRENLINAQLEHQLSQYTQLQDELAVVNERYHEVNGGVVERQKKINQLTENIEQVKQEMEERGAAMSDGSPLVNIKKAIKEIQKEIAEMNIYIAVSQHMVLSSKLREKSLEQQVGSIRAI